MIQEQTVARIKAAAKIEDILTDQGVTLHKRGAQLVGLCPFHDDRSEGSFQVSKRLNICSCYSCGAMGLDPIATLIRLKFQNMSEKEAYPAALRYIAAMYNIYVDDEVVPVVEHKAPILPPPPKLQIIRWFQDLCKPFYQYNVKNPLLQYLRSLPLKTDDMARLEKAIVAYKVGTYPNGYHEGWTIWWLIDYGIYSEPYSEGYVHSGKMMKYKSDGHRDKAFNATWTHTRLAKAGKYNPDTHRPDLACYFGEHLLKLHKDAIVKVVESEKTALIRSAFDDMDNVLWLATGGMQNLNEDMLLRLLEKDRTVELYPDYDGYPNWEKVVSSKRLQPYVATGLLSISNSVRDLWKPEDGPKADIADIMIRIVTTPHKSEADKAYEMACAKLDIKEHEPLKQLINNLQLK